eukprot:gene20460-27249_t
MTRTLLTPMHVELSTLKEEIERFSFLKSDLVASASEAETDNRRARSSREGLAQNPFPPAETDNRRVRSSGEGLAQDPSPPAETDNRRARSSREGLAQDPFPPAETDNRRARSSGEGLAQDPFPPAETDSRRARNRLQSAQHSTVSAGEDSCDSETHSPQASEGNTDSVRPPSQVPQLVGAASCD